MTADGISIIVPIKPPEPYYPLLKQSLRRVFADVEHEILEQYERGLVNAIVHGAKRSRHSTVAVMDADGSHRPIDLYMMYRDALRNNCDLIIGSKVLGIDYNPLYRKVASWLYRFSAKVMLNYDVTDPMSGIAICRRNLMLKVKPTSEYKFVLQLLLYAQNVREAPIVFLPRKQGKSKINPLISIYTFYNLFKLRRKHTLIKAHVP